MNAKQLRRLTDCLVVAEMNPRRSDGDPMPYVSTSSLSFSRDENYGEVLEACISCGSTLGNSATVWVDEAGQLLALDERDDVAPGLVPGRLRWTVRTFPSHASPWLECEPITATRRDAAA